MGTKKAKPGPWVPIYYGNWFKIARELGAPPSGQENSPEKWRTLNEAAEEARRRNQASRGKAAAHAT